MTLGDYDPATKTGPAVWLRPMIARTLPAADWPANAVPILYLPGVSRHYLRAVEECPRALQPLAELQYRGTFWTQSNTTDREASPAVLRAELDAYYARLCGLTRKGLRYILDPHSLTNHELENILDPAEDPPDAPRTKDFPGETFRVLKEREMREYGEYRTRRLVLAAWDRLAATTCSPAQPALAGEA